MGKPTTAQPETVTMTVADLEALLAKVTGEAIAKVNEVPRVEPVDLSDPTKVAKSKLSRALSKYFKGGDAANPIGYGQRKRIMALAARSVEWDWNSLAGLTTAQAAVASHHLERQVPVRFKDFTITPA